MQRTLLIVAALIAFLVISLFVSRWLNADTVERGRVADLLRAQERGDAGAMLRALKCRDSACVSTTRANARSLRSTGELKIVFYESGTSHALGSKTRTTRVVWLTPSRLTTVQCVLVQRRGNPFFGSTVSLLRLSAPIGREASCH